MKHITLCCKMGLPVVKAFLALLTITALQSCDRDDPMPPNEEEVITTVVITLVPQGGGEAVTLRFFDADGELGDIEPLITVSGPLAASTTYAAAVELSNESATPVVDVSEEIVEEANDHLFCYAVAGNIVIYYEDEDDQGYPLGLITRWETGAPGDADVVVTLRHQPGTKTDVCPGGGETDVQVAFSIAVE